MKPAVLHPHDFEHGVWSLHICGHQVHVCQQVGPDAAVLGSTACRCQSTYGLSNCALQGMQRAALASLDSAHLQAALAPCHSQRKPAWAASWYLSVHQACCAIATAAAVYRPTWQHTHSWARWKQPRLWAELAPKPDSRIAGLTSAGSSSSSDSMEEEAGFAWRALAMPNSAEEAVDQRRSPFSNIPLPPAAPPSAGSMAPACENDNQGQLGMAAHDASHHVVAGAMRQQF